MQTILEQIVAERRHQIIKWGEDHDSLNTLPHWAAYIGQYATRHFVENPAVTDKNLFKQEMIKIAALAVAAIEAINAQEGN